MFLHYRERTYHTGVINRTLDHTKKEFFFGRNFGEFIFTLSKYSLSIIHFPAIYIFPLAFIFSYDYIFSRPKQSLQFVQECFHIQNYCQVYVYEILLLLINIIMFILICSWNFSVIWSDIMLG